MKLYTRASGDTVKKTIQIFREEARSEKKIVWLFSTLIPLSHFIYIVLLPLLISFIVQSLIEDPHDVSTPLWLIGAILASGIFSLIIQHLAFTQFFYHEERMTTMLTKRAMEGLLVHSHGFFSNQKVGSLAGDVNTFSRSYMSLMDIIFLQASNIIVSFVTSLIIIGFIAPILLLPLLLLTGFVIEESLISFQKRSVYRNQRKELQSKLFGSVADVLGNQTLVRMFGKSNFEVGAIVKERRHIETIANKEIDILQGSAEIRQSGLYLFQILTMLVIVYLVSYDMVSIAALVFTVTYLGRVTGAMYNINNIVRTSEQAFLDASKITEILDQNVDVVDAPNATQLQVKNAKIEFSDVSFSYQNARGQSVIKHLNIVIPSGQSVGLVGKSGGGKSTLSQLLLRYMDVSNGQILIDEQNIAEVTQSSLREALSYVPQDPYLFHRSLRENIAYGKDDATDEEILAAANKAHALEFIDELPNGLDTIVGERGIKLSGGQRQRIAIARAILKDAPILILDEATSSLDSESEKFIQLALASLMSRRTSIVIAHRLSTIAKLDRIIVLENGSIVEDGTHTQLLAKNGTYARLWSHQSGGFIEE